MKKLFKRNFLKSFIKTIIFVAFIVLSIKLILSADCPRCGCLDLEIIPDNRGTNPLK